MQIINATPHDLHLIATDGTVTTLPRSEYLARAEEVSIVVDTLAGFPVYAITYGPLTGLPDTAPDVIYVVSLLAARAGAERGDLVGVADMVRDESGRILGARGFARVAP